MNSQNIDALFNADHFRAYGKVVIEVLADYLGDNLQARQDVLHWINPTDADERWQMPLPYKSGMSFEAFGAMLRDEILAGTLRVHHPRNMGHQVAPPLPVAALCDLVAALTNQAMAVYETGPTATMIERQVIRWLAELVGFKETAGFLTSGGAQANLTALLAARQCMGGGDAWKNGVDSARPLRILASAHAHYSVSRAGGIMGLGTQAVIPVPTNIDGRMNIDALRQIWLDSMRRGEYPFAVVATAGCTPTGSIDPLGDIADFCEERQLWMHVDGAHGASGLLSKLHRGALTGIERADSIVWDGHKLMYMPATVSAVLFRTQKNSYAAFAQEASYLFYAESEEKSFDTSYRTLECTKRMMGLKLWAAFSLYGADTLGELVDHVYSSARRLALLLETRENFQLLMQPQTNIVCFRYLPKTATWQKDVSNHQAELRRELVENGKFHLTQTSINGDTWLRATIMNPLTSESDFQALLRAIETFYYGIVGAHK